MTRKVDLVSYLPPFLAEFKEIAVTLEAENPEFVLVWNAAERVLYNEFIETADEYGISRFEKILNILPSKEDTLENRRERVQIAWSNSTVYTYKWLKQWLDTYCGTGKSNVGIQDYTLNLTLPFQSDYLYILDVLCNYLPCNNIIKATIEFVAPKKAKIYTGMALQCGTHIEMIVDDLCILTDESGNILTDENGKVLYEGAM